MIGLFFDENIQGRHVEYLRQVLAHAGLWDLLAAAGVQLFDYPTFGFPSGLPDRTIWNYCQDNGPVLFTDDRNNDGPDSLQATLDDSHRGDSLPTLTIADKGEYENSPRYAERVGKSVAEVLFGLTLPSGDYWGIARLFVPLPIYP